MLWPERLLFDLPTPGPKSGWLADSNAAWWLQLRAYYSALRFFDNTFDATFE